MVPVETQSSTVVANNNILGPVESRCRDMHKVKRKETVFSISREYGISEAELIAANPELKGENKIKKGTFLCIPYPKAQAEQSAQPQAMPTDSELFRENRKETERFSTIKAAVILPFLNGCLLYTSMRLAHGSKTHGIGLCLLHLNIQPGKHGSHLLESHDKVHRLVALRLFALGNACRLYTSRCV